MDARRIQDLERMLKVLASGNRLALLVALQEPRRVSEIDLPPTRASRWGSDDRAISRQAVRGQIKALEEIGVVQPVAGDAGEERGDVRYVVNHARLFVVTEELRELATIQSEGPATQETVPMDRTGGPGRPAGPHLVLVRGVREGEVFPLAGEQPDLGWLIGRRRDAHVCLDYDLCVSGAQARVFTRGEAHVLADLEGTNPTLLNGAPMAPGSVAPLEAGDLVGVGMSLLVYRR